MALSRSLVQPFRKNMLLVGAGWRAYFAPWDYVAAQSSTSGGPNILDLEVSGPFNTNSPPIGWTDTGWVNGFKVTPGSKVGAVRSGYRGAIRAQYRGEVGLDFELNFREYGRLQSKLSSGTQVYNILTPANGAQASTTGPLSTPGATAISMGASGYQPIGVVANYTGKPTLYVPAGSGAAFPVNSYLVSDVDYTMGSSGVLGENGAFAFPNAVSDVDYIRKTSDFVARVVALVPNAAASQDALILDQPFAGGGSPAANNGIPPSTSKVQAIKGWTAREGGTFIQEWSGLFISDTIDGAQAAIYLPHVSIAQFNGLTDWTIENAGTTDLKGMELGCKFTSLAFDDPEDGETVVGYYAFYPNQRVQNTY